MRSAVPTLSRKDLLQKLPQHVLYAVLLGAVGAVLLSLLQYIQLPGRWNYLMAFPFAAVYVNAAVLPLAIPGRHWSFAFIAGMMMVLISMAAAILSAKVQFPHSVIGGTVLPKVNTLTFFMLVTGGSQGLFYGVLVGRKPAMVLGLFFGLIAGYLLGMLSLTVVTHDQANTFVYNRWIDFAWQGALALGVLHLAACLGAVVGAKGD